MNSSFVTNSDRVIRFRRKKTYDTSTPERLNRDMVYFKIFISATLLLLITSCGKPIEREKLIGRYTWNDNRTDTLEIRTDGTYEYWTFKPGRKLANSGTWKFNSMLNEVEFELENFPFLKNHVPNGSWFSRVKLSGTDVHLTYEPDHTIFLKQIKASPK